MKLYNTLSRTREEFIPLKAGEVSYYSCGPTVYNYAHIGNLRTYVFADILKRALIYFGYHVKHVMNITDVGHLTSDADTGEDKMLAGARREHKTVWEIAEFYTTAFKEDIKDLGIIEPSIWCKATDHIAQQIQLIGKLMENECAYQSGGNVYFDTSKFSTYGQFARLDLTAIQESRVGQDPNKKNQHDFVLWFTKSKFSDQDMKWSSPWGIGYPGWHIECSAMSTYYLGQPFDIHSGGIDHIAVHHTNEIAQSEAGEGKRMVNYWLHGEFLVIDKSKMAKSEGNFITLRTIKERGYDPLSYRYFCLQAHYRQQLNFTWEALTAAQVGLKGLRTLVLFLKDHSEKATPTPLSADFRKHLGDNKKLFDECIADDLNIPKALGVLHSFLNQTRSGEKFLSQEDFKEVLDFVYRCDTVLGLRLDEIIQHTVPEHVGELVTIREAFRNAEKWHEADEIRKKIEDAGYQIEDTAQGVRVIPL